MINIINIILNIILKIIIYILANPLGVVLILGFCLGLKWLYNKYIKKGENK